LCNYTQFANTGQSAHKYCAITGATMKTLREMIDIVEGKSTVVSDEDLKSLIHDIVINFIFHKQRMHIDNNDPTKIVKEVKKAYQMENIPFTQIDLDRVIDLFPLVMKKIRKGFAKEYIPGDND